MNQIEEVCKDIEKTINQTIQNTLNQLERDCEQISSLVDQAIKIDDDARRHNFRAKVRLLVMFCFSCDIFFVCFFKAVGQYLVITPYIE